MDASGERGLQNKSRHHPNVNTNFVMDYIPSSDTILIRQGPFIIYTEKNIRRTKVSIKYYIGIDLYCSVLYVLLIYSTGRGLQSTTSSNTSTCEEQSSWILQGTQVHYERVSVGPW